MNTKYFPYKRLNDLLESYNLSFSRITDITLNNGKHVDGYSFIYHDEYLNKIVNKSKGFICSSFLFVLIFQFLF